MVRLSVHVELSCAFDSRRLARARDLKERSDIPLSGRDIGDPLLYGPVAPSLIFQFEVARDRCSLPNPAWTHPPQCRDSVDLRFRGADPNLRESDRLEPLVVAGGRRHVAERAQGLLPRQRNSVYESVSHH